MGMKRIVIIALVTALAAPVAWAQQAPSRQPAERETPRQALDVPAAALLSSSVIGARVKNREGKDLGEIDQLVIDPKTGQISHAILGLGGLAGVGETKVVVHWKALQLTADPSLPHRTIASVDQAAVERAPRWDRGEDRRAQDRDPSASPPTVTPMPRTPQTPGIPPTPGPPAPRY